MVRNSHASTLTSKGQITVPKEVRERLGLKQGDRLEFVTENGHTLVRRTRKVGSSFAKYAGALGTFSTGKKEINKWLRDLRDPAGK